MVRPGRLADRFNRWAIARGFPLLAWLAPRWPRWLLFANARWIIALVMALYSGPKAEIDRNFARILGLPPRARAVRRARRAMLRHFAYYWVDLFRFPQLPPLAARRLIASVRGLERVEALREAGRPVLLLTAHLPVIAVEAVITAGLVAFLQRVRPEVLALGRGPATLEEVA